MPSDFLLPAGWKEKYQDPEWRNRQVEVWRKLLGRDAVRSGLLENLNGPKGRRILICGFFAFVQPAWLCEYLSAPFPFVGDWVMEEYAHGNDTIILSDREVAEANAGQGLHSLGLANGWCPQEQPLLFSLKHGATDGFIETMVGFNLNEFVTETIGQFELEYALANGTWRERSRFQNHFEDSMTNYRPILLGITRAEAQEPGKELSVLGKLFLRPEIRFFFPRSQQKLLLLALVHVSDQQLSQAAGVKIDALGRRFDRIYKRVEQLQDTANPVFPADTNSSVKRRLLLSYLEKNMAELRPYRATNRQSISKARSSLRGKSAAS